MTKHVENIRNLGVSPFSPHIHKGHSLGIAAGTRNLMNCTFKCHNYSLLSHVNCSSTHLFTGKYQKITVTAT